MQLKSRAMSNTNISEFDKKYNLFLHAAHELNTPLTSMVMAIFLIKSDDSVFSDKNKFIKHVDVIEKSCDRLNRAVKNVLLFHQLNEPNFLIYENKFDEVHQYVNECTVKIASQLNRENDYTINFSLDANMPILISREHFVVVISELIHNAFNFSTAGSKVLINFYKEKNYGVLSITDFGIGMEETEIDQISAFTQFNRLRYEQQGLGIGFTLAKKLVEKYFGVLTINSIKDKGTTVRVALPIY
jgi:signal transduction histidine kinase